MQNFKNLKVYEEAFQLSKDIFEFMEDKRMSLRAKEQLLASVSSICANLAEMGAFDSIPAKKQKVNVCNRRSKRDRILVRLMLLIESYTTKRAFGFY
ncbi:TPA: four helix bundle protein [Candidatus Micrarchaeota archaeon]|nr:four helix bundle protein [Candidatus Micrarchaeota archaeon]